jgi:hypothetical protein
MDATTAPVSFDRPVYWDEIVAYGKLPGGMGDTEKRIAQRPPQEHINAAFADMLDKIQWKECRVNQEYLKALGMGGKN